MEKKKLCIECKYCFVNKTGMLWFKKEKYLCEHPENIHPVTGKAFQKCNDLRNTFLDKNDYFYLYRENVCGRKGLFWKRQSFSTSTVTVSLSDLDRGGTFIDYSDIR